MYYYYGIQSSDYKLFNINKLERCKKQFKSTFKVNPSKKKTYLSYFDNQ